MQYPMYTVPAGDLLEMTRIEAHEELMARGDLVIFDGVGNAGFVSHQWVSKEHPDPELRQMQVLQATLRRLLLENGFVSVEAVTEAIVPSTKGVFFQEFQSQPLFLWYDYFSVPQRDASKQEKAIHSIPAYVAKCRFFFALCPTMDCPEEGKVLSRWPSSATSTEPSSAGSLSAASSTLSLSSLTAACFKAAPSHLCFATRRLHSGLVSSVSPTLTSGWASTSMTALCGRWERRLPTALAAAARTGNEVDAALGIDLHSDKLASFALSPALRRALAALADLRGPMSTARPLLGITYTFSGRTRCAPADQITGLIASRWRKIARAARSLAMRLRLCSTLVASLFRWSGPWHRYRPCRGGRLTSSSPSLAVRRSPVAATWTCSSGGPLVGALHFEALRRE